MAKHLEEALLERFSPISSLRIFQPALAKNFSILNYFSASWGWLFYSPKAKVYLLQNLEIPCIL